MRISIRLLAMSSSLAALSGVSAADATPAYCIGEYAEDLSAMAPKARELESHAYSFCVRSTAVYECLSYGEDGGVRRTRRSAIAHGTAFAYRRDGADTLLLTNEHVAAWPAVTEAHSVDGVPAGCKRVSETLRVVDNEEDRYESDDVPLQRVVADARLDAAVLRAKAALPLLPWQIGKSSALHERDVVEVRGFPLAAFQATSVGKVISAFQHDDEKEWDHDDFVIDALLSSGNSGSPVLAVSCRTGELELVGVYHAGYIQGSALNVVVGIDQLRELMTTLRRSPRKDPPQVSVEGGDRMALARAVTAAHEPLFPLGGLTASVRARSDGALIFQVFRRDFPFHTRPLFAFEDLPSVAGSDEAGRIWFGNDAGLKGYLRRDLDAEGQALVGRATDALRSDALAFLTWRSGTERPAQSRSDFERLARMERELARTVAGRRELASSLSDLADRLAPHPPEAVSGVSDLFAPRVPRSTPSPTSISPRTPAATASTAPAARAAGP